MIYFSTSTIFLHYNSCPPPPLQICDNAGFAVSCLDSDLYLEHSHIVRNLNGFSLLGRSGLALRHCDVRGSTGRYLEVDEGASASISASTGDDAAKACFAPYVRKKPIVDPTLSVPAPPPSMPVPVPTGAVVAVAKLGPV